MATTRKDLRGRTLRKGEMQRSSDKRYAYSYTDPLGRRKYIYANDLVTLREKEAQLTKDQMDGLDIYVAGKATVNFVFDRYMSLKTNLRQLYQQAEALQISKAGAYNLLSSPDFPTLRIGGRKLVMKNELVEWLKSHTNRTP